MLSQNNLNHIHTHPYIIKTYYLTYTNIYISLYYYETFKKKLNKIHKSKKQSRRKPNKSFKPKNIHLRSRKNTPLNLRKKSLKKLKGGMKGGEETVIDEPVQKTVIDEPGEETVIDEPVQKTVIDEPGEETVIDEPVQKTVIDEPSEETVIDEPVQKTVIDEPSEETVIDEPVQKTVIDEPSEETVIDEPVQKTVIDKPGEQLTIEQEEKLEDVNEIIDGLTNPKVSKNNGGTEPGIDALEMNPISNDGSKQIIWQSENDLKKFTKDVAELVANVLSIRYDKIINEINENKMDKKDVVKTGETNTGETNTGETNTGD